jgi:hypothetical protein
MIGDVRTKGNTIRLYLQQSRDFVIASKAEPSFPFVEFRSRRDGEAVIVVGAQTLIHSDDILDYLQSMAEHEIT